MSTISVLVGLLVMTAIAFALGDANFSDIGQSAWLGVTTPFFFGIPKFNIAAIISMLIVMAVTMVETTGDVFATGEVVGKRITPKHVANALRADGLSTFLGGIFNSFPYTCFAQNVGLVRLTRVKSRWVVTAAGIIMIILGILPKAGAVVASIPGPVIGGASLAMFANVAVVGIQTLSKVDMRDNRNAVIVSTSIGLAMLVTLKPDLASLMPSWLQIIFGSGVTIGALTAFILNLLFFHVGKQDGPDVAIVDGRPVDLDQVNAMDRETFVEAFKGMYDGDVWPVERAWEQRPFTDATELRKAFEDEVLRASADEQEALINAYVDIADLASNQDGNEQAHADTAALALGEFNDSELKELQAASAAYREKFNRPLVVCVTNLADREQLIASAWKRVESSQAREARFALGEVIDIADERFNILVADANPIRTAWGRNFDQVD
ncbi:Putative purine permease ygfU [Chlamydia trachomatis]|nr:Putative purine permease ygfU [Chlamydia trachomatis]